MSIFRFRAEELNSQVQFLRDAISEKDDERPAAGRLNSGIVAPLMPYVRNNNLIIIPHDVLHYLSFAALWDADRGRYLVEDYTIAYAPSASALSHILEKRNENEGRLLALGDPDDSLDQAANEARTVAQLYGVEPLIGAQATESQFYDQIGNVDILHLATHAAFNTQRPLFSGLVLAPDETNDGNLEVHEVFELDLPNINLVVLSACNTALGEQSNGDELVGLTRAFLYAGVPAVVTTQWSIEDRASAALMTAFYRHLREGMTNARALQAAQLQVMAQDEWKTPYYWAAFSLSGDHSGRELADVQK